MNGLYTDLYELTMAQAFVLDQTHHEKAVFEYFFREAPFDGRYVIFAGLETLLNELEAFRYDDDAAAYLQKQGFRSEFTSWLQNLDLSIDIYAPPEGTPVFPREPIIRVEGPIAECLLIETLLLNIINFESLIATKASRMRTAAGDRLLIDFGLRRAHGMAGRTVSRAAVIGGFDSSSNVLSGKSFGHPVSGTQAHAWIQSFDSELEAFRTYAHHYPDECILLIDTYDTLKSGLPNAITVAQELEKCGHKLKAVRIDSGDLADISRQVRHKLDEAGFDDVKIAVSSDIDEFEIERLDRENAAVDVFGIGTRLVTAYSEPALNGVYKLVQKGDTAVLKISDNPAKTTLPGVKKLLRFSRDGKYQYDWIGLASEPDLECDDGFTSENLHQVVFKDGERTLEPESLTDISARTTREKMKLHPGLLRFSKKSTEPYEIRVSGRLKALQSLIVEKIKRSL